VATIRLTPVIVSSRLTAGSSVCCLGDLRVENSQIRAQSIELPQMPLDCGALVIRHDLFRQPDPTQSPE
jgi:hypothetical protein